jgi:hypothetical protein
MLEIGAETPDVRVWTAPNRPESLREVAAGRPLLLVFYLFDWSAT